MKIRVARKIMRKRFQPGYSVRPSTLHRAVNRVWVKDITPLVIRMLRPCAE